MRLERVEQVRTGVNDFFDLNGFHCDRFPAALRVALGWHNNALHNPMLLAVGTTFIAPRWTEQDNAWCSHCRSQMSWTCVAGNDYSSAA